MAVQESNRGLDLEIISHFQMCQREGTMLQGGMHFRPELQHSVILMSRRKNAPYDDQMLDESTLLYEGHDAPNRRGVPVDPKTIDQPRFTESGSPTQNGLFYDAALRYKQGTAPPRRVRVYEKIQPNIWTYNGTFHLVDAEIQNNGTRNVFKFKLLAVPEESDDALPALHPPHRRLIPSWVKQEVFSRDKGRCTLCGSTENIHYDHELPYSKGGSSLTPANIRILCGKHNLQKSNRIE